MRITGLANVSTGYLSETELAAIQHLIDTTPGGSQALIDYHGIPIVAHPYGFLAHTGMVIDDERPPEVSDAMWSLLNTTEHMGCDWVLFDRDERLPPPSAAMSDAVAHP